MMAKQVYEAWKTISIGTKYISIDAIIDDWEGFRIIMNSSDQKIRVAFPGKLSYLVRDESDLHGDALRSSGLGNGSFYIVHHSDYKARFISDSISSYENVNHYAIVTDGDCVDVLTCQDPIWTVL